MISFEARGTVVEKELSPEQDGEKRVFTVVGIESHNPDRELPQNVKDLGQQKNLFRVEQEDKDQILGFVEKRIEAMNAHDPSLIERFPGFLDEASEPKPTLAEILAMSQQIMLRYTGQHVEGIGKPNNLRDLFGESANSRERPQIKCNLFSSAYIHVFNTLCEQYHPEILDYYVLMPVNAEAALDVAHERGVRSHTAGFRRMLPHGYLNLVSMHGRNVDITPIDPYWVARGEGDYMTPENIKSFDRTRFRRIDAMLAMVNTPDPVVLHEMILEDAEGEQLPENNLSHALYLQSVVELRINKPYYDTLHHAEVTNDSWDLNIKIYDEAISEIDRKDGGGSSSLRRAALVEAKTAAENDIAKANVAHNEWSRLRQVYLNHRDALALRALEQMQEIEPSDMELFLLFNVEHSISDYGAIVDPRLYDQAKNIMKEVIDSGRKLNLSSEVGYRMAMRATRDEFVIPQYKDPDLVVASYELRLMECIFYSQSGVNRWMEQLPQAASLPLSQQATYRKFLDNLIVELAERNLDVQKIEYLRNKL